ncbi:Alpha-glucuronidase A like protein [Verticillium longisporum]|nr:Alpha-glucuronidase A like protein [Verticillium longisporum]
MTFNHDPLVIDTITKMLMESWPAYENYSGNLGVQTLTDILHGHYGQDSTLKSIVSGRRFGNKLGGYAGVVNVGHNTTWLGSHLAMSNLYAYGRLAWDPSAESVEVLEEWTKMTFNHDPLVIDTITKMSMESWLAYENYSGNLGVQTLTDILHGHYGPNPASQDNNPWGQWTRADANSIGMDRTVWNGTGNAGQYPKEIYEMYENIETTPDNLLLWFHHSAIQVTI